MKYNSSTYNKINISHYAEKHDYQIDILRSCLKNDDLFSTEQKKEEIRETILQILNKLDAKSSYLFNHGTPFYDQFCFGCCHMLAEHLLYTLYGHNDFDVTYIRVFIGISAHSLIEIKYKENTFFIDAGGIYSSIEHILGRYTLTPEKVELHRFTGEEVIDEGWNDEVRKLSELTKTWEVISDIADNNGFDSSGDIEDDLMNNITMTILKSNQYFIPKRF